MRITLARGGQQYGPFTLDQVNSLLIAGKAAANDLAWVEGTPDWVALGTVPGIVAVPPPLDGAPTHDFAADTSELRIMPAFLLAFFLGVFGAHRFYVGKNGSAVAMLILTLTLVGVLVTAIWATIDWILIVCGEFRDVNGMRLRRWT
jgi:TM2 domain-containing membrane protein YozV